MSTHKNLKTATENAVEITEKLKENVPVITGVLVAGVVFLGVIAFVLVMDLMIEISVE